MERKEIEEKLKYFREGKERQSIKDIMEKFYISKLKNRMKRDYGIKLGKVSIKEYQEIMRYKGNKKRDFRLKSFKRKGNLRVIYLYV